MNKFLVIFALIAPLALCEPEAGAEAHYGRYYGRHGGGGGYRGYGRSYGGYSRSYQHRSHPVCRTVYDVTTTQQCSAVPERVCNTLTETQYKTEYDNVCNTVSDQVCHTVSEQVCNTVTEQVCNTVPEQVCRNVVKQVPDKQCATTTRQQCVTESHPIVETSFVEECHDIETKHCEETALVGVQRNVAVQPIAGGAIAAAPGFAGARTLGHHIGKREADGEPGLLAGAPRCQAQVRRACNKRPVEKTRLVSRPRCTQVPETHCVDTVRAVPESLCNAVPKQVCHSVPRQECHAVPRQECHSVPRQECHQVARQVPFQVPRQACRDVPRRVCRSVPHKVARQVCKNVGYGHGTHH